MGVKIRLLACTAAIAVICVLAGCQKKAPAASSDPGAAAGGAGSAVGGGGPSTPPARDIEAFGTVRAKISHTISLGFPMVVEKKLVSEGQRVKAGDALFRFSAEDYEAQINARSLELQNARFDLRKAEQERQRLEEDLTITRSDADEAEKDLKAKQDLFLMGAVSKDEVDASDKTLTSARQRVRELSRSLEQYAAEDVNGLEIQKARIANQERDLARMKDQLSRPYISGSSIVADMKDGTVVEISCADGDPIPKDKKICSLMDMSSLIVEANVSEEFIKDIRLGSPAEIVPLADHARTYKGKVTRISAIAVKVNGETVVPVELSMDALDDFLRPNFNVDIKIH
jgi:HlyD family secretion protein